MFEDTRVIAKWDRVRECAKHQNENKRLLSILFPKWENSKATKRRSWIRCHLRVPLVKKIVVSYEKDEQKSGEC